MYDLIIIGGGPAGTSAAVYAGRKRLSTLLITSEWGGQSIVSPDIQNWIGTPSISGDKLANDLREHVEAYAKDGVTIISGQKATTLSSNPDSTHSVTTADGTVHTARAILVATGSSRRHLTIPGANTFENKGVTYCASCDGPMFSDQDVVVIGGGNAGFETAAQLLAYTKSVTLLHHSDTFKADAITVEKVTAHPNMTALTNVEPTAILGENFVSGVQYKEKDGKEKTISATGVFVEIGMIPNTNFVTPLIALDEIKRIPIDPWTQKTEVPGIWAAGDCTNIRYHQNNISAGDGVRALEDIYITLMTH